VLLQRALSHGVEHEALGDADRRLLAHFATLLAQDFADRLAKITSGQPRSRGEQHNFTVKCDGAELFEISCSESLLVAMVKAAARPSAADETGHLTGRLTAMGKKLVPFEVMLGEVELSFEQFNELQPGDVIVFDADLTGTLDLRMAPGGPVFGKGKRLADGAVQSIVMEGPVRAKH
jgi:hypothetical protein